MVSETYKLAVMVKTKLIHDANNQNIGLNRLVTQAIMLDRITTQLAKEHVQRMNTLTRVKYQVSKKVIPLSRQPSREYHQSVEHIEEYEVDQSDDDDEYYSDSDGEFSESDSEEEEAGEITYCEDFTNKLTVIPEQELSTIV